MINLDNFLNNYKTKIFNGDSLLVINGAFHNLLENNNYVEKINDFTRTITNKLIVLTGNLSNDITVQPNFFYKRINIFDRISNVYWKLNYSRVTSHLNLYRIVDRNYKFYWATNNDNHIRRFILEALYQNNLINNNLVNYKCGIKMPDKIIGWEKHAIEQFNNAKLNTEHIVPLPPLDNTTEFNLTPIQFFQTSYLQICVETYYPRGIFLSEKVFNAINQYQLFFYIGNYKSLEYLKNKGYEIFEDLFNLEYDNIQDPFERLCLARKSLIEYLNKPIQEIKNDYIKSVPKIIHNKNLLLKQRPDLELKNYFKQVYEN